MTRSFFILGLIIHLYFYSFSQSENWNVYMANYEKGAGSTVLDMSYKINAPLKEFPFLLVTGITVNQCDSNGLPASNAFDQLYIVSDKIKSVIDSNYKNKFVGTFTYQCERVDYYYLTDTSKLRANLEIAYKNFFPQLNRIIKLQNDSKWEAYLSFLYPNEETLEYLSNQQVVLNLTKSGDKLTEPRQVDHWIYFNNEADRDKFANFITLQKYKIEDKKYIKESPTHYQLRISRVDNVDLDSITKITIELRKKALEYNGEYDGWETFIIK